MKKFFGRILYFLFRPEIERRWTTLYYGHRGSGKTQHQAAVLKRELRYLRWLHKTYPYIKQPIVYSIQRFNEKITKEFKDFLYYWDDATELRYCPRKKCWRGKQRHPLHGAVIVFDDIGTILPPDEWRTTPMWLRKIFKQGRHFGIRVLANVQDPFDCDINFRRTCDIAYRFRKILSNRDPDETRPKIKRIFGLYLRRRVKAETLWKLGDKTDEEIQIMRLKDKENEKIYGVSIFRDAFAASYHLITKNKCELYDTLQNVQEYKPRGFQHTETKCNDPTHPHCKFKKTTHSYI